MVNPNVVFDHVWVIAREFVCAMMKELRFSLDADYRFAV